jgi:hypothetical protein
LRTFSRSTSAKYCGTLGSRVVKSGANSGRFRAAARNLSVFSARNAGSLPERSSRMKVTPPEVPMPGIAGGENAKTWASATPASFWFSCRMITSAVSPFLLRASQSSSVMK